LKPTAHNRASCSHADHRPIKLRPVTCTPLTRDAKNPKNVELNDVLGNYSLTLIDSLSSLAILASAPLEDGDTGRRALKDFQNGVAALVEQYGDGTDGPSGQGLRGRGFDVDSKVQVFETVIRGVGGLLSAHLFAVGELPITGYNPRVVADEPLEAHPIAWPDGFKYNGQLLRLAHDLGKRLLPAFYTNTGMPYPRVNLRHGIPFYLNSPLHGTNVDGAGSAEGPAEITETCSAGAGSLVLEFTVLSRLTEDPRFEQLAKRAFWAVWYRRSDIGLIGAGVDAEQGKWIGAFSVIGAGADSFFEYALKSHILLSGHSLPNRTYFEPESASDWHDPNTLFPPLSDDENSPDSFLEAWHQAHAAIKRHLYNDRDHPHYVNVNIWTGSLASQWIDSLGAYYSGLLTLAGELEEAIETNLLYAAVWTKYAALPERWNVKDNAVEGGLGWWPLRPEFIESTYHIYRATRDPWYLYVGEMVQRDISRRCWTTCGWAGLQNVLDGEKSDRMESFFLGETTKYMYLLFDEKHPLNSLDASFVFTTEGHPLILPKSRKEEPQRRPPTTGKDLSSWHDPDFVKVCPVPPPLQPLTGSGIAARSNVFHAFKMVDLHMIPNYRSGGVEPTPGNPNKLRPKSNHTVYPWTLPHAMLPDDGTCAKIFEPMELTLEFASNAQEASAGNQFGFLMGSPNLERLSVEKIRVLSISGLKLTFRLEDVGNGEREWRATKVNGVILGRDECLVFDRAILSTISDPRFNMVRDNTAVKFHHIHRVFWERINETHHAAVQKSSASESETASLLDLEDISGTHPNTGLRPSDVATMVKSFFRQFYSSDSTPFATPAAQDDAEDDRPYFLILNATAVTPTGRGVAPLPVVDVAPGAYFAPHDDPTALLPWTTIFAAGDACGSPLPDDVPANHQVVIMRRGGCSFSEKLTRIPLFTPGAQSLQLVVMVSEDEDFYVTGSPPNNYRAEDAQNLVRPLLDDAQATLSGLPRRNPIPMVMVGGGEETYRRLAEAETLGFTRRYFVESQGVRVRNIVLDDGEERNVLG
jgi:hypothetical protein